MMQITVLGSGTSTGVPLIGCDCGVCTSILPENKRSRSSIFIAGPEGNILIDTSTDLRQQVLANGIRKVDSVLFTHSHADHVHGIDELRSFNHIQKARISCYGSPKTISNIKRMFFYIFEQDTQVGGGLPRLDMIPVEAAFPLHGWNIQPIPIIHGRMPIYGYRIGNMAYVTDCSDFPPLSIPFIEDLDLLFVNALRFSSHATHFNVKQALSLIQTAQPKKAILTHLGHDIDYHRTHEFPKNVELAYDGMVIDLDT